MPDNDSYSLFDRSTQALIYGFQVNAIQRMLDFDYICKRETPSVAAIINPTRSGLHKCFWGTEEIFIPMYRTTPEAASSQPQADVLPDDTGSRIQSTAGGCLYKFCFFSFGLCDFDGGA